jgi:stage II sporulation protein E
LEYKEQENNNARLENINITHIHTVSKLLYGLASEIEEDIVTNEQLGEEIRSQLLYRNISAQALVVEKNAELEVFLYVRTEDANEEDLRKAVSGVLKRKMQVDFLKPHDRCHVLIKLTVAPNLDCVFGVASEKKHLTPETGDSHLVSKLGKDMFLAVVADGMGSGKEAANASGKVLELLENFFKAGFKANEAAMTINKIFAAQKVEVLSSVDAACINLKKEEVDFIKLGACPSFVLRQGEVIAVCGEDLPLGAVYASSAVSNKQTIRTNDMIVKISDGVYDAFTDIRFLVEFLKEQKTNNPKVLADSILGRAVELNRQIPRDDMTVLCIRIFKRH